MNYREYGQDVLNATQAYIEHYDVIYGDVVPSKAGLCRILGIGSTTVYRWQEVHEAFAVMMEQLKLEQERKLINYGLTGRFNSALTKLALVNHGYSDKSTIDHNINPKDFKDLTDDELNYVIEHGRLPAPS